MNYQEKYENLLFSFRRLQQRNEDLQREIEKINDRLDDRESRVRELEPLEREKNKRYDDYVTSGGNDPCFQAGMSGKCGPDCPVYGSQPECM